MGEKMRYEDCINELAELQKEAQKKIIIACQEEGLSVPGYDGKTGNGIFSKISPDTWNRNDRKIYSWITVTDDNKKEYLIDLFYSEIDPVSGNCHSQIGRVCFVKDVIYNPGSNLSSPNVLLDENGKHTKMKLDSKRQVVKLEFGQYKWENPLKYIDKGELSEEDCQNKCWISVGDVLEKKEVPRSIAKAMKNFISKANQL